MLRVSLEFTTLMDGFKGFGGSLCIIGTLVDSFWFSRGLFKGSLGILYGFHLELLRLCLQGFVGVTYLRSFDIFKSAADLTQS